MILELPSVQSIVNMKKIPIMVAPPGLKVVEFDCNKTKSQYEDEGWVMKHIGEAPTTKYCIKSGMRCMRRQYGLKHHVTSTVHACMGDTLHKVVTEISNEHHELKLWDKGQVIVLLSSTEKAKTLFLLVEKRIK